MLPETYALMAAREDAHFWYRALHERVCAALARAGLPGDALVLDVGCGTGGTGRALKRAFPGARVHGFDAEPRALAAARGPAYASLAAADANALPAADATADAAVCLDVLSCRSVDPARALAELRRCLRPGGAAVVNVPAFAALRGRHDAASDVHRRFRRAELGRLLAEAGFAVVEASYWNTVLAAAMLPWRRLSLWLPGGPSSDVGLTPPAADRLLEALLRAEGAVQRRLPAPFGASLLALARRP